MRRIITDQKERIGKWVAQQIGINPPIGEYQAIGMEDENKNLIAGVVYDQFKKGARCSMHCAGIGKRWLTKAFLWFAFDFPFNQLGVKVIINNVDSANKDSVKFIEHCGFVEKGRIEDGCGNSDLLIFALHRNNCKWLGALHG